MTATDDLIQRNKQRHDTGAGRAPGAPTLHTAVVTCMDCRIELSDAIGLRPGEAHVIRNAGGVVTDDVIRSLSISQRKLGTREIVLMHHTKCGMQTFAESDFKAELEQVTGQRPTWSVETFTEVEQDLRQCMTRLRNSPFLTETESVRGFVHDLDTDEIREVL